MSADKQWVSLLDLEQLAKPKVAKMVDGYYSSGSESEATLRDNRAAFSRLRLLPRCMVDVSQVDMRLRLFGRTLSSPLIVAPMAMQCMAHPTGESATAAAAAACGVGMSVSTMATQPLEDVAWAGSPSPALWFQLYVLSDRDFVRGMVLKAQKAGYQAIVVTVDAPFLGHREADERAKFRLPEQWTLENLKGLVPRTHQQPGNSSSNSSIAKQFVENVDASLTWEFVAWLRDFCSLRILVKGILSAHDAIRALEAGVDGIIASNHGGRQLDFAPAALDTLPGIKRAIGNRVPLIMDGGVRRGTDILKALALGADAVQIGRPILHGLALDGQRGVEAVLKTLQKELALNLALAGRPTLAHISRDLVIAPGDELARL